MNIVTVIIPVHNRLSYTQLALRWLFDSIQSASDLSLNIRVIVVDDGSLDDSAEWISQNYPQVIVLPGSGQLWWSGAVNLGAKYALDVLRSDYILLWNNDIKPDPLYFSRLFDILRNHDKNTMIGSKIFFLDRPDIIFSMGCTFDPQTGRSTLIDTNQPDQPKYNRIISADWAAGMGTLIPKEVFPRVGFWDARAFPQYHGDSDFALRARQKGVRLVIHPDLKIWNDKTSTGLAHNNSFGKLLQSFFSLKSNHNVLKNIRFCHRHAESVFAYGNLIKMYVGYIGGFFKWKLLALVGKSRKNRPGCKHEISAQNI